MSTPRRRPGENLFALRKARKMTQAQLADRAGTTSQQIHKLEKGKLGLSADWIYRLSEALDCNPADILVGDASTALVKAPLISWVQAGKLAEVEDPYEMGAVEQFVYAEYGRQTVIALTVRGDSMDRIAPDGSRIVVDYEDRQLIDGRYYVVKIGDEATFKRYRAEPARFEPDSTQPHDTIFPNEDALVVGRVVQVVHTL